MNSTSSIGIASAILMLLLNEDDLKQKVIGIDK